MGTAVKGFLNQVQSCSMHPESYIVLNDAEGNALAAIQCKYVKNSGGEEGGMFSITQGNGTITPITSGDYFEGICGNFSVTEVYDITVSGRTTIIKSSDEDGTCNRSFLPSPRP